MEDTETNPGTASDVTFENDTSEQDQLFASGHTVNMYRDSLAHIRDELRLIDRLIHYTITRNRNMWQEDDTTFSGLYISDDEVNSLLQTESFVVYDDDFGADPELGKIETFHQEITRKKAETLKTGKRLRLQILTELFQLTPFDVNVLLICLAAELDLRYEKLYAYLQNDVTKKRPCVDLTIRLLCHSVREGYQARAHFAVTAPLMKHHLIHLISDRQEEERPLLSKYIKLDERIIHYLLESDEIDANIRNFSTFIKPKKIFEDMVLPGALTKRLTEWVHSDSQTRSAMFLFQGPYGTGKKSIAEAMCNESGTALLVVDARVLLKDPSLSSLSPLTIILRECQLQDASLFLEGCDAMMKNEDTGIDVNNFFRIMDDFPAMIFLSGEQLPEPPRVIQKHSIYRTTFNLPPYTDRKLIWESLLRGAPGTPEDVDIDALATKFKFSGGQIRDAIFTARTIARTENSGTASLSMEALYRGCKARSNTKLASHARKIEPHYTWNDIVLPEDTKEQLKEISGYITFKGTVYNDWGFDRKLSLGKGLNVLFSGPSGTGKTMAAEIIAGEAGLDIYKIDLSGVVSKYIGETEKNLHRIFREAETSNAILFFDEADALFGKRAETRDAHDRYANIEINYLLQKMEEHEGIVILATNFKKNVDEAFLRRMHFAIEFPPPDETSRRHIWRTIFPADTPVEAGIDFGFLSKFKITGGNIKNIALSAAFLAASSSGQVTTEHLIKATKREFQKMGKLCTAADFGKYYELVK